MSDKDVKASAQVMVKAIAKASAYGGVLINYEGCVLLREPAQHYDGYVWTFAKGRPDPEDSPQQCVLREVLEETGYRAEIIGVLDGVFKGGTSSNAYFVMRPLGEPVAFDWETQSVRWVNFEQAAALIALSSNSIGRKRDLAVLAAAQAWWQQHQISAR